MAEREEKLTEDEPPMKEIVGYRKPPLATRFRKGQSGNPRGRPRGRRSELPYEAALGQEVIVRENGRERRVSAAEAFLLHLTKRGLEGDSAAAAAVAGADLYALGSLLDKSLVRADGNGRYDLHALARHYAALRLAAGGETAEARQRHADYYLAQGGAITRESSIGLGIELNMSARVEVQSSVRTEAFSHINDFLGGSGEFPDNPPIDEATFAGASVSIDGSRFRGRWRLGADVLAGDGTATGRLFGSLRQPLWQGTRRPVLTLKAGVATSPTLAQQEFRLGGVPTVRGFDYGTRRGQSFWAAQADLVPFAGFLRPVVFADVGWAGDPDDFGESPLVGAGIGVSLYSKLFRSGVIRFDLSRQLSPGDPTLRFDIILQAVR